MSRLMVVERKDWLSEKSDPAATLRAVYDQFQFRNKKEISKHQNKYIIISAKTDQPNSELQQVSEQDFFTNTLNPLAEKVKALMHGKKPALKTVQIKDKFLIFVYSAV